MSFLVAHWLGYEPPSNLWETIDEIQKQTFKFDNWSSYHCYREGNKVADILANWGLRRKEKVQFFTTTGCLKMLEVNCEWTKLNFPLLEGKCIGILSLERYMYSIHNFDVPWLFYLAKWFFLYLIMPSYFSSWFEILLVP